MKKYSLYITSLILFASINFSCEDEKLDPALSYEGPGGTLTAFKAYTLETDPAVLDSAYGRVVFWQGLDGNTLVQLSLYNVPEDVTFSSAIMAESLAEASSSTLMSLYDIENTGEGYDFGEFTTSKFYVISDPAFYGGLSSLDANVSVMRSGTLIAGGDIGANATPVEEN